MADEPEATDWAYAAGFVDGEGCIAIIRSFMPARDLFQYGVSVVVANRDREVLEWMRQVWSGYLVRVSARPDGTREAWNWRSLTGQGAEPFLQGIRPWLRIKEKQCDNALEMILLLRRSRRTLGPRPMPAEWRAEQERLYWMQRELNHRGTAEFIRQPSHSPRQISRARALAAAERL